MSRGVTVSALALLVGCGKLLGLEAPVQAGDGGASDAPADGPTSDFTVQLAHASARVPAGSFDFIDVTVSRAAGIAGQIVVDVPHPPAGVTTVAATIAPDAQSGRIKITGDTSLTIGATLMLDVVASGGVFTHDAQVNTIVTGIPGTLDTTFGGTHTGLIDLPLGTLAGSYTGLAVDSADQPVAAGTVDNSIATSPQVAFLHPDGTLLVTSSVNTCSCSGGSSFATLAIASTGRVLAIGQGFDKVNSLNQSEPLLAAFSSAGSNDTTFNANGFQFIELGADLSMTSLAVDASALFLLTGNGLLSKFTINGGKDFQFNSGEGFPVQIAAPGPQAIAIDPTVHVYVAGTAGGNAVLERITEQGVIDTAFGTSGVVDSGVAGTALGAIVEADHAVIVGGVAGGNFLLFRVLASGALDPAFGTAGISRPVLAFSGLTMTGMTVQTDGKILLAGNASGGGAVLARYLPNGALDPTFGTDGAASIPAGLSPVMGGVALQSTGMIVIDGGNADTPHSNGVNGNGFIARVWF